MVIFDLGLFRENYFLSKSLKRVPMLMAMSSNMTTGLLNIIEVVKMGDQLESSCSTLKRQTAGIRTRLG
jgi:hypothetical protein